jgi:hypothetical protein
MSPSPKDYWRKATDHVSNTNYIASRAGSQGLNGQSNSSTRVPRPASVSSYASAASQQPNQQFGESSTYYQGHPANLQQVQHQPQGYRWPDQAAPQQRSPPASTSYQGAPQQPLPQCTNQPSPPAVQYAPPPPQQASPRQIHQDWLPQNNAPAQQPPNYTYPPAANSQYQGQDQQPYSQYNQQAQPHNRYPAPNSSGRRSPERRTTYDPNINSAYDEPRPQLVQRVWTAPVSTHREPLWHNCNEHWDL